LESGNRITDETGQKVFFNTDTSIAAFQWMKDLYTNPANAKMLPPGVNAWDDMGNNNAWYAGTIGFTSNAGTIFATALKNEPAIGKDTVLVPQPAGPTGKKEKLINYIVGSGTSFYLASGAKNVDAAKATMQYLLAKDTQTKIFATSEGYVNPAYDWGWDTDPVKNCVNNIDLTFKQNAYDPNQIGDFNPSPNPLLWVDAVGQAVIMTDTIAAILKGTAIKDAVNQGQTKIEALVKQYNGK
jgi:multiple sugar transport system substrate-binding protein